MLYDCAGAWCAGDLQFPIERLDALTQPVKPGAGGVGPAHAVVQDPDRQLPRVAGHLDASVLCVRMLGHVGQRLGGDVIGGQRDSGWQVRLTERRFDR